LFTPKADQVAASQDVKFSKLLDEKLRHNMDISLISTYTQVVFSLKIHYENRKNMRE